MSQAYTHVQRVRVLYKLILKLHRGLPEELQIIGTNYARDEFKRHKKCAPQEAAVFMNEWTVSLHDSFFICIIQHSFLELCNITGKTIRNQRKNRRRRF